MSTNPHYDAIIIGAGAAGLFCGAQAGQLGHRVLVIDHAKKPAEKVRISGGGRCNFTNIHTNPANFLSNNPHFAKSALARFTPQDFIDLLARHKITWHEKTLGQLFCDGKSAAIINMLLDELAVGGGELRLQTDVRSVRHAEARFTLDTSAGDVTTDNLIIASGGLSIPQIGASGFAYDIARQFGHTVVETRPALVPLTFSGETKEAFAAIAGVACDVRAQAAGAAFDEALLFTHRGLSGPAILQVSSYWAPGSPVVIDLFAGQDGAAHIRGARDQRPKQMLSTALEARLPKRLVEMLATGGVLDGTARLADLSNAAIDHVAGALSRWQTLPTGTEGYRTAEVTAGGVETSGLSSKTMESRHQSGLYFIGECVDVTGWLGGYNFQWAWASAHAAATGLRYR